MKTNLTISNASKPLLTPLHNASVHASLKGPNETIHIPDAIRQSINDFFQSYGVTESRDRLWQWYRLAVTGEYHQLEPLEMASLLGFYEGVDELLRVLATSDE